MQLLDGVVEVDVVHGVVVFLLVVEKVLLLFLLELDVVHGLLPVTQLVEEGFWVMVVQLVVITTDVCGFVEHDLQ